MPRTIMLEFKARESTVAALEIQVYAADERTNNGAPCGLMVRNGSLRSAAYWGNMRRLADALNATPDTCALRPSEVRPEDAAALFNKVGERHTLGGGENGYIDCIRRADVAIVAAKTLRELRALGMIAESDYVAGLAKLAENGFAVPESLFRDHRSFQPGTEKTPMQPKRP